ncbi:hypothetical protein Tco_1576090 [Tanacetum coccineum]
MTMPRMQLNSKFVNNMLPEWGRFVTAVKLNKGLRDSNYDQLYAYLKQHKAHANENKMMLERFTQHTIDPLALMSNVSHQQYSSQSSTTLPSIHGHQNRGQGNNARGAGEAGYRGAQNRVGNANPGQARQIKYYNCNGGHDNVVDEDVDENSSRDFSSLCDNVFYADDRDAFDSDVDEAPTTQTMLMANISSADPVYDEADALRTVQPEVSLRIGNKVVNAIIDAELATFSEHVKSNLKRELRSVKMQLSCTINHNKLMVQEVMSLKKHFKQKENKYLEEFFDMKALKEKVEDKLYKQDQSLHTVHMLCKPKPYYDEQKKVAISYKNPLCLTRAKQIQPALYNGHKIIKTNHVPAIVHNSEDTLEIAETTRKLMNEKMKDPEYILVQGSHQDESRSSQRADHAYRPIKSVDGVSPNTPASLRPRLTKSKVVSAKQTENVSTSKTMITEKLSQTSQKSLTRYQRRNQQYQEILVRPPTSPETHAIAASMQSVVTDRPWYLRLWLLKTYDEGSLMAQEFCKRVYYVEGLGHNLFSVGHNVILIGSCIQSILVIPPNLLVVQSLQDIIMVLFAIGKRIFSLKDENKAKTTKTGHGMEKGGKDNVKTLPIVIERSGIVSGKHDESSRPGNDTDTDDIDIKPIYDEEPMAEVQSTPGYNVFAKEQ